MSDIIMRKNIYAIALAFAKGKRLSLATVSGKIHGNQTFFPRFMAGEISTGIDTYFAMIDKFRADWPKDTPWPKTVPVPAPGRRPKR